MFFERPLAFVAGALVTLLALESLREAARPGILHAANTCHAGALLRKPLSAARMERADFLRTTGAAPFPTRAFMVTTRQAEANGRTAHAIEEVRRGIGITQIELVYGDGGPPDEELGCIPHDLGCRFNLAWAHRQMWRAVAADNLASALILEDDVLVHDSFAALLPSHWSRVPPDFEIVYLGCNPQWLVVPERLEPPTDTIQVGKAPLTMHAYVVTAASAARFAALYDQMVHARGPSDDEPGMPQIHPFDAAADLFLHFHALRTAFDSNKWISFQSTAAVPSAWGDVTFLFASRWAQQHWACTCEHEYSEKCKGFLPVIGAGLIYQHYHCNNVSRLYEWWRHYKEDLPALRADPEWAA